MTIKEIEAYLQKENEVFSSSVLQEIEIKRSEAIKAQDEVQANECWRLAMIYYTQKEFVSIWQQLKRKRYEAAWESVRQTDIQLMALEQNFGLGTPEEDPYHLVFIRNTLPEYIKLFPYEYFISREAVIKQERCSICGEPVKLRGGCGHIPGKVYMGEVCVHTITDMEYLNLSAVQDPFDKYDILKPYQTEYNYGMLDGLMQSLRSPYEYWYVEVVREKNPGFAKIGRNDPCPCGSGKKFKHCCMNDPEKMYFDHYKIRMMNELEDHPNQALKIL